MCSTEMEASYMAHAAVNDTFCDVHRRAANLSFRRSKSKHLSFFTQLFRDSDDIHFFCFFLSFYEFI